LEEENGVAILVLFVVGVAGAGRELGMPAWRMVFGSSAGGSAGRMNIEAGDGAIVVGLMCTGSSMIRVGSGT
jgi:hypothetical protein